MKSRLKVLLVMMLIPVVFSIMLLVSSAQAPDEEAVDYNEATWCNVAFYNRDELWYEEKILQGSALTSPPKSPEREGYRFCGWSSEEGTFEPGARVYSSARYDAVYELLPPTFEISSLSFQYDGKSRELCFSEMEHPYLNEGLLSY